MQHEKDRYIGVADYATKTVEDGDFDGIDEITTTVRYGHLTLDVIGWVEAGTLVDWDFARVTTRMGFVVPRERLLGHCDKVGVAWADMTRVCADALRRAWENASEARSEAA